MKIFEILFYISAFHCLCYRICARKGWFTSRLVLALPENYKTKANVALYTYPGPTKINALFDWMKSKVNQQIQEIDSVDSLEKNWLQFSSALDPDVRVLFVSTLSSVPLFLSALSVKFPGRVKIGSIKANTVKGKELLKRLDLKSHPRYLVITKRKTYIYGNQKGESMTFKAMEMFLKSIYPSMNDIFIVSIMLTNIACGFELCLTRGSFVKRILSTALSWFQYNIVLLLVWFIILGLLQLPIFQKVSLLGLYILRFFSLESCFSMVRRDIAYFSTDPKLPSILFSCMNVIVYLIQKFLHRYDNNQEMEEESDWWNFSNLRTINYHNGWEMMQLRPFDQIFNPSFGVPGLNDDVPSSNITVNSNEYIKFLPVWVYKEVSCHCQCGKTTDSNDIDNDFESKNDKASDNLEDKENLKKIDGVRASSCLDANYRCECSCTRVKANSPRASNMRPNPNSVQRPESWQETTPGLSLDNPWNGHAHSKGSPSSSKQFENYNRLNCKPLGYMQDTQCVICLGTYKNFALLRGLPCKHVFHDKCILAWLLRDNHFCPTCRWPAFQTKDAHVASELHSE